MRGKGLTEAQVSRWSGQAIVDADPLILNVPISFTKVSEGPVLGSAMLAAMGAGIYPDIPAAAENMVHTADTIEPDPARHEEYKFYVDRYMEAYPQMKELMHKTERHVAGGAPAAGE